MKEQDLVIQTTRERWIAYGACISALGIAITHFVGNLIGYINAPLIEQNIFLFLAWGVLPSLIFFAGGWSVLSLAHFRGGKKRFRTWLIFSWISFVLFSLQFIWLVILGFLRNNFTHLYHLGPGPWSVFGTFLFGFTLWKIHRNRKKNGSKDARKV